MKKFFLLLFSSRLLLAVTLVPLYQTVDSKNSAKMTYDVSNPSKDPVAVDFSVLQVLETNGTQEKRVRTSAISAHPTQFVIKPGETKKVRVRYMKTSLPQNEEVYRIIAKELDISVNDKLEEVPAGKIKADVKMRYTYEGLLFVKTSDAVPKLFIETFKELPNLMGRRNIEVVIQNKGTASSLPNPKQYNYIVTINNKEYTLTAEDFSNTYIKRVLAQRSVPMILENLNLPSGQIQSIRLKAKPD